MIRLFFLLYFSVSLLSALAQNTPPFRAIDSLPGATPWTHLNFDRDTSLFQFAIVSDNTGGAREGVFADAVRKLNMLRPEFVMSVGDLIEGYTQEDSIINSEWDDFHTMLKPLKAPFFFLPGNHDISNDVMRQQWQTRYGTSYYAFTYQNVLFLCLDTNDGDGVTISDKQVAYARQVIAEHSDVRWTMIFLHHPIWDYQDLSGFQPIEQALQGRDYTVVAGHRHRYLYEERNDQRYLTLATTGGGSQLRGPRFGEYDHIVWVTMSDDGPTLVNLQLEGIHASDVVNPTTRKYADHLLRAVQPQREILTADTTKQASGVMRLYYHNPADIPLQLDVRLLHHHQLKLLGGPERREIPAGQTVVLTIPFEPLLSGTAATVDPLQYQWQLRYATDSLPGMQLSGTEAVPIEATAPIAFTPDQVKFLDEQLVELRYPGDDATVHYTLNGSPPNQHSPTYTAAIAIDQTTTFRAQVFQNGLQSPVYTQTYEKVKAQKAQRVRRPKAGLSYAYYEGSWTQLPDFATLTPVRQGATQHLDVERLAEKRKDPFALRFTGYAKAPEAGIYLVRLRSDKGAKLWIDGQLVVDNDGLHGIKPQHRSIALEEGYHAIEIQYVNDSRDKVLHLDWRIPTARSPAFAEPEWYH